MTPTESRAFEWLINERDYRPDHITFQGRTSPDFLTADGRGWEVKLLTPYGKSTVFSVGQLAIFRIAPPTVLFWLRDWDRSPILEADFRELPVPGAWCDVRMDVRYQPAHSVARTLRTAEEVDEAIIEYLLDRTDFKPAYQRANPPMILA